ncbi:hypothetical protein IP81_13880 [Novosphingobium sp. AAP83]|uniref:class I SAM-dependent methyltransferase n=1 Tax=Novosphingobium sp. AAP83 TaxID=1523425 RepID=UPI0006B97E2C|nr:class I SAM-dependent methyltransferase [Novosphingobium sp. AAP83]KPF90752.1 hypothetical protein IP81_13880 [Novosphingobium sp. AAP83]
MPIAQAYPDAEVIAIDTAGPTLRYGAARAAGLGVKTITFVQANGEDLSPYPDNHFDWVQTTIFPPLPEGEAEDLGRAAVRNAYAARKKELAA